MEFVLGCVVFFFWLSMTTQYGIHTGDEPNGRPLLSAVAGGVSWGVASFEPWGMMLVLGFLGYSGYLYYDLQKDVRRRRIERARSPEWAVATPPLPPEETSPSSWQVHAAARAAAHAAEPHDDDDPLANWHRTAPPATDPAAIERVRRQSLAAMKRATAARRKDKEARNEHDAAPLAWSPTGSAASALAEIEFDYVDARGKKSHRRVDVSAVDGEYLEGFCHEALATRTFVIGRVRGKVLDCSTGELLTPKRWAAQARKDPKNSVVNMGED